MAKGGHRTAYDERFHDRHLPGERIDARTSYAVAQNDISPASASQNLNVDVRSNKILVELFRQDLFKLALSQPRGSHLAYQLQGNHPIRPDHDLPRELGGLPDTHKQNIFRTNHISRTHCRGIFPRHGRGIDMILPALPWSWLGLVESPAGRPADRLASQGLAAYL